MICLVAGMVYWHLSRPTPPKLWNTTALVAAGPPTFHPTDDHKGVEFVYSVENETDQDYKVESPEQIKFMVRQPDGTVVGPVPENGRVFELPIFIPARQKGQLSFSITVSDMPSRTEQETDDAYHERLRSYLQDHWTGIGNFSLYDEANHYQINLPRWLSKKP